jgi:membrane protease YdiL (CAAX protease family)
MAAADDGRRAAAVELIRGAPVNMRPPIDFVKARYTTYCAAVLGQTQDVERESQAPQFAGFGRKTAANRKPTAGTPRGRPAAVRLGGGDPYATVPPVAPESQADGTPGGGLEFPSYAPVLPQPAGQTPPPVGRAAAFGEVVLCSGFPTQVALAYFASLAGYFPFQPGGRLSFGYVGLLLLVDSAVLVGLILWFLRLHGERPRDVLLDARPVKSEALLGLPLTLVVLGLVFGLLRTVQWLAPWLHNVAVNPLEQLVRSPRDAAVFVVVAVAAGGIREEIQRAFILHRFAQRLGGPQLGLVLFSLAFGAGHALQGWDAAITTAALGALWGSVYLARRSIVAPMVSHSVFNSVEILIVVVSGT